MFAKLDVKCWNLCKSENKNFVKFNVCLVEFPSYRALDTVDQGVGLKEGGWGVSCRMGRWVVWGKEEGVRNATGRIWTSEDWNDAGHTAALHAPLERATRRGPRGPLTC